MAAEALCPAHFFVGPGFRLEPEHIPNEEVTWEIFHGRLLDRTQTTRRQFFEAWNLFLAGPGARPPEPVLALKFNDAGGLLHVVRAMECYVWEPYEEAPNVIQTRETRRWVRELVGTISLSQFPGEPDLLDEIICRVFQAVVGTSRLPLTSLESPLPAFSLGQLSYIFRPGTSSREPIRSWRELLNLGWLEELALVEKAKLLETLLHTGPEAELDEAADLLTAGFQAIEGGVLGLLQVLFNEASLSPYTDLVDKALHLIWLLETRGHIAPNQIADFLGSLLCQLGRHLTAYDLVTFHHRGANYPDALLLDAALKAFLELAERLPNLFESSPADAEPQRQRKRLRRRALRQGWLLRRRYEGHLVPDAPTSQGESTRVLPPPHVRVPEEQILYSHKRTKRLYEGDPLDRHLGAGTHEILRQSIRDLEHSAELRELGLGLLVDRPLDGGKGPLELDQTPLLSYLAFSRSIARRRLEYLARDIGLIADTEELARYHRLLESDLPMNGIPVSDLPGSPRRGAVSLADASRAADDYVVLRNTASSATQFRELYGFDSLAKNFRLHALMGAAPMLVVRRPSDPGKPGLAVYDGRLRKRVELDYDSQPGYRSRGGLELPASPLRVVAVWEETDHTDELRTVDLTAESVVLTPCP
jgi:hypothetical protein